jgi:hypothetical protein
MGALGLGFVVNCLREKLGQSPAIYVERKVMFTRVFSISFFDTAP